MIVYTGDIIAIYSLMLYIKVYIVNAFEISTQNLLIGKY